MGIIGILFDIIFHLVGAVIELIVGIIGAIFQYFWPFILIGIVIWLIVLYHKVRIVEGPPAAHIKQFGDGATIKYDVKPPNFRHAYKDELGMPICCTTCKFRDDIRNKWWTSCTKHSVKFSALGGSEKMVCDDYKNIIFDSVKLD